MIPSEAHNQLFLVIGGTDDTHRAIARDLGAPAPSASETIALPVVPVAAEELDTVFLEGRYWRLAHQHEIPSDSAPRLPPIGKKANRTLPHPL